MNGNPSILLNAKAVSPGRSLLVAAVVLAVSTAVLAQSSIRLHDKAAVRGGEIRLDQVAKLVGNDAVVFGDLVITTITEHDSQLRVTLEQIREQLSHRGANWGKISLGGYAECKVYQNADVVDPLGEHPAPLVTNPTEELALSTPITLRDRVVEALQNFADSDGDDLRIIFSDVDTAVLNRSAWQDRYEIAPLSSSPLGRVPVVIRQYHEGLLAKTFRVTADVQQRCMAVVAKNPVGRYQTVGPDDVEIREVYLDADADHVLTDLSQVIGFVAGSVMRRGAVVRDYQLRSPTLIRRGELITVRCISGGLVIKTVARANEDGVRDQLIQVRNEKTRKSYTVRVTAPRTGMALMSDDEQSGDSVGLTVDRSHP